MLTPLTAESAHRLSGICTDIIPEYIHYLTTHWKDEKYKWIAVKHFQEHWDINAVDFKSMLEASLEKTENLLASSYFYAKAMLIEFAAQDPEATRAAFISLYDETKELTERVAAFQAFADDRRENHNEEGWKNHYQNTNAISTYLWLRYPDKYYIYKYSEYSAVARELSSDFIPKRTSSPENMVDGYGLYNEVCEVLKQDRQLIQIYMSLLADVRVRDPECRTLTMDCGFYISRYYSKGKLGEGIDEWWPQKDEYDPELTVEDWISLLRDKSVFTDTSLLIVKRLKEYGGAATCSQLAAEYGESPNFYNGGSSSLAKRIAKKTGCPIPPEHDNENARWWPILYVGRSAANDNAGKYIWKLRDELSEALERLNPVDGVAMNELELYTKEDFLKDVYMSEDRFDALAALLKNKKNIILQGAPGVGKTFTAKRLAYAVMGRKDDSRIEFIQFHQSYSYEDFIMGYKPDGEGFKLTDGIFYRFCQTAARHPNDDYFFIIDEINRGNLSKIFGELLMLIEKDYRGAKATLAYSGQTFSVPRNLYIIGMMNTADRSLALIDYALRRRFSFFEMEPGFTSDGFKKYQSSLQNETFDILIDRVKELNKEIYADDSLGAGFRIGHSYFCGQTTCTDEWMREIVHYDLIPMLREYWFDDKQKLQRWENTLTGVFDD